MRELWMGRKLKKNEEQSAVHVFSEWKDRGDERVLGSRVTSSSVTLKKQRWRQCKSVTVAELIRTGWEFI